MPTVVVISSKNLSQLVRALLVGFTVIGVSVLLLRYSGHLAAYTLSVGLPLLLGFMGVLAALHEDWAKRHRWIVIIAFAVVSLVAFYVANRQALEAERQSAEAQQRLTEAQNRTAEANAKLADTMSRVGTQTNEISRVQDLNTELQQKLIGQSGQLIDSSKTITDLSKQSIDTAIGGDSFCYMTFMSNYPTMRGWVPFFVQVGKYPLYKVNARILDMQKFDKLIASKGLSSDSLGDVEVGLVLGDMAGGGSRDSGMGTIPANTPVYEFNDGADRHDFRIWFSAFNGVWHQDLYMRKDGTAWIQAVRVRREKAGKLYDVFKQIPPSFPRNPDWHN